MTPQTLDQVRAALELSTADIRLMAGEMSAQEMRSVKAVLAAVTARIEALAALDAEKGAAVAWEIRVDGKWKGCLRHKGLVDQITKGRDVEITPLYASPPQAAPSVAISAVDTDWAFARAKELAEKHADLSRQNRDSPEWKKTYAFRFQKEYLALVTPPSE